MKVIVLVVLLVAGSSANGYGNAQPAVRTAPYQTSYGSSSSGSSYGGSSYGASSSSPGSSSGQFIPITSFNQEIRGSESSSVSFEAGNGIKQSENTHIIQGRGSGWSYVNEQGQTVQSNSLVQKSGTSSFTTPEGQHITLTWTADENGFHPQGDHLPTPPPVPQEIQASLRASNYGSNYGSSNYGSAPVRSMHGGY